MLKTKYKSIRKTTPANPKVYNPKEISKMINYGWTHFIVYPDTKGYSFALFYRSEKTDPFEIVAVSNKSQKLKSNAIRSMKKILDGIGQSFISEHTACFDQKGDKISLKIHYDVKKLL